MYIEEQIKLLESRCLQFDHLLTQHAAVIVSLQAAVNKLELDNQAISLINTSLQDRLKLLIDEDLPKAVSDEVTDAVHNAFINPNIDKQISSCFDAWLDNANFRISVD